MTLLRRCELQWQEERESVEKEFIICCCCCCSSSLCVAPAQPLLTNPALFLLPLDAQQLDLLLDLLDCEQNEKRLSRPPIGGGGGGGTTRLRTSAVTLLVHSLNSHTALHCTAPTTPCNRVSNSLYTHAHAHARTWLCAYEHYTLTLI